MNGMDMGVATRLGSFASFVALWVPMMAAMMLPGATSAVLRRAHASGRVRAMLLFVGSYLAVWTLVGDAVYTLYRPHGPQLLTMTSFLLNLQHTTRGSLRSHRRRFEAAGRLLYSFVSRWLLSEAVRSEEPEIATVNCAISAVRCQPASDERSKSPRGAQPKGEAFSL
jgi:Predicted metal-binding integral membrane protein (DUF2182)